MKNPIITILLFLTVFISSLAGQDSEWKALVKSQKRGGFPKINPIQLTYQASFNNLIRSGNISFVFNRKDKRYPNYFISQSYGGSTFKLLPYKYDMTSFASPKSLAPKLLIANEHDDEESVKITNKYGHTSVVHKKSTTEKDNKKISLKEHTFSGVPLHDPLTAMLLIREQKLIPGEKTYICVHPFSTPYFCTVTVLGKEVHKGQNAIKLNIGLRKIDKKTGNLTEYKKLKKATIWLSDDARRIPIEFRIEVKLANKLNIGSVRLNLTDSKKP